jgi:excisionase family DNA binding protein
MEATMIDVYNSPVLVPTEESMTKYVSTKEAAAIMGVSDRFVRKLAEKGDIAAIKIGWSYIIELEAAKAYKRKRPPKD